MKSAKFLFVCSLILGIASQSLAQDKIHWATQVEYQYNQYSEDAGSAQNVLGEPSAHPYGEPSSNAYRLAVKNGFGRLIVSFDEAVNSKQIIIIENYLPGRINKVIAYDKAGSKHLVYDGGYKIDADYRVLRIPLKEQNIEIKKIELSILAYYEEGHAEIDAIGVTSSADPNLGSLYFESIGLSQKQIVNTSMLSNGIKKVNLGSNVNSRYDEVKPVISPFGHTIYFSRQNHPDNFGSTKDEQDIFYAEMQNGLWSNTVNIGNNLNDRHPNGVVSISSDGNTLYLINDYQSDKSYKKGLSLSRKENGVWQTPEPIRIKSLYNFANFVDYSISPNGQVMVMAMSRLGGQGGMDLYVSFYEGDNTWSAPSSLGKQVNSKSDEFSPFIAADGKTLYFSSYGHNGLGDSDIFISRRLDDSWSNWSAPTNLGSEINTSGFDAYFTIPNEGSIAYMVSDQGSIGGSRDIYRVELEDEFLPENTFRVIGQVLDADTREPISGELRFSDNDLFKSSVTSDKDLGLYEALLELGTKYEITTTALGYEYSHEELDLSHVIKGTIVKNIYLKQTSIDPNLTVSNSPSMATFRTELENKVRVPMRNIQLKVIDANTKNLIESEPQIAGRNLRQSSEIGVFETSIPTSGRQFVIVKADGYLSWRGQLSELKIDDGEYVAELSKIEIGKNIVLSNLLFVQSSDVIIETSNGSIDELFDLLEMNENISITLHGHTDNIGSEKLNKELSEKRVITVKNLLVERGVDPKRIKTKAYGGSNPIASNATERTRRLNRRVEFSINEY
ncbi:OmpA family protein [Fulvivirgaceae bacterium LMO-SS25]